MKDLSYYEYWLKQENETIEYSTERIRELRHERENSVRRRRRIQRIIEKMKGVRCSSK